MKKGLKNTVVFALLAVLLFGALLGCGGAKIQKTEGISVVTTIFPPYDFAKNIAQDRISLTQLLPSGTESHSYEPTPKDIIAIQSCQLFIYTGGVNDAWVDDIIASMGNEAPMTLKMMDCVDLKQEEHDHDDHDDHDDHQVHRVEYDEHVWLSPKNAKAIVLAIAGALCQIDSQNAALYNKNADSYIQKLDTLDASFTKLMEQADASTIVVGDRFPFRYLADEYGIKYHAAYLGCSSDTELSAKTVASLCDIVKQNSIPVVFYIEFSDKKAATAIAEDSGAELLLLHSCHNVSKAEREQGCSYLSLMEQNLTNLRRALTR